MAIGCGHVWWLHGSLAGFMGWQSGPDHGLAKFSYYRYTLPNRQLMPHLPWYVWRGWTITTVTSGSLYPCLAGPHHNSPASTTQVFRPSILQHCPFLSRNICPTCNWWFILLRNDSRFVFFPLAVHCGRRLSWDFVKEHIYLVLCCVLLLDICMLLESVSCKFKLWCPYTFLTIFKYLDAFLLHIFEPLYNLLSLIGCCVIVKK